jgi:argininosuccinate synthase
MKRALVVYSGGLDTTVCIPLLREEGFSEVHTVTVDVGQPVQELHQAESRARALGAVHHVVDAKREFAEKYCVPAIWANGDYFGYPLSTALARPLIAEKAAEVARAFGPFDVLAHGCTGKGNDQFRIEFGLRTHLPGASIRAPIRERNLTRREELAYARKVGAPVSQSVEKIYSIDENLWGRSIEGGMLEDPAVPPPEEIYEWTVAPEKAPEQGEEVEVDFEEGVPVALGGERHDPLEMIRLAHQVAGRHGVGRIDMMEDRVIGLKARENYECPASVMLITAHRALEALVCTYQERRFKDLVDKEWSDLVYKGLWGDPLFEDLMAFVSSVQKRVTGRVRLRLYKGSVTVLARQSPWALYSERAVSFEDAEEFDQREMTGMVKTYGQASLLYHKIKRRMQDGE